MVRRRRALAQIGSAAFALSLAGCASLTDGVEESSGGETPDSSTAAARRGNSSMAGDTDNQSAVGRSSEGTETPRAADGTPTAGSEDASGDALAAEERSPEPPALEPSAVSFGGVPTPEKPGEYRYARLGSDDATATATLFGSWKCNYTQEFVLDSLGAVIEEFVKPGDLAFEFRSIGYAGGDPFLGDDGPRASRAGLAVWNEDPASYWQYFGAAFTNQPSDVADWATTERLVRFARFAGVDSPEAVERAIADGSYVEDVVATTDAASERGVSTVPRIAAGGTVTAPTVDLSETKRQLRDLVED